MSWWIAALCLGGLGLALVSVVLMAWAIMPPILREHEDDREKVYEEMGL